MPTVVVTNVSAFSVEGQQGDPQMNAVRVPRKRLKDEGRRKTILKAASQLFLQHGYAKTSMDAIALQAGVTKQTIYAYFNDKDTLFAQIIVAQCEKHKPDANMLTREDLSPAELLYKIGIGFLDMITSKEGLATTRLIMAEAGRRPKLAELFYETGPQTMNDLLEQFLNTQNARGVFAIPNTQSAASYFYSMLKGRYHLRMALRVKPLPTRRELQEHVRETVKVFLLLYGGDKPLITEDVLL